MCSSLCSAASPRHGGADGRVLTGNMLQCLRGWSHSCCFLWTEMWTDISGRRSQENVILTMEAFIILINHLLLFCCCSRQHSKWDFNCRLLFQLTSSSSKPAASVSSVSKQMFNCLFFCSSNCISLPTSYLYSFSFPFHVCLPVSISIQLPLWLTCTALDSRVSGKKKKKKLFSFALRIILFKIVFWSGTPKKRSSHILSLILSRILFGLYHHNHYDLYIHSREIWKLEQRLRKENVAKPKR